MDDALAKILDPNWKPTTKVWSSVDTPWGRRVYQRNDVDWDFIRPDGPGTNSEAALLGYAPLRQNSKGQTEVLVLHHFNNDPGGSVIEVWSSTHTRRHSAERLNGKRLANGDPRGVPDLHY